MAWLFLGVVAFLVVVMALAWLVQWRTANAGWVDAFWSFGTGIAGAACALWPLDGAESVPTRQWAAALLALLWCGRLGLHIAIRTAGGGKEDVRYARFREEWGTAFQARMFGFLMIQAAAAAVLAFAILVAARNPVQGPFWGLRWLDLAGIALLLISIGGEALADRQMHAFRSDPANKGGICEDGLWAWSRHPNYFFEFLGWWAYPLMGIAAVWPWGWGALAGPAFMYLTLVYLSGIPPTEREMLRSRGAAFRDYQARVSAFVPLPPGMKETQR